jgi:hypothetical protein
VSSFFAATGQGSSGSAPDKPAALTLEFTGDLK